MKTVSLLGDPTPRKVMDKVFRTLIGQNLQKASDFMQMVESSVNLNAKNTKNMNHRDLAVLQVCHLANKYDILVEIK